MKKIAKVAPLLGILLGIALLAYPWISEYLYENQTDSIVSTYETQAEKIDNSAKEQILAEASKYNTDLRSSTVTLTDPFNEDSVKDNLGDYSSLLCLDDSGLMGAVEIPTINVNLPIYHGTGASVLEKGVGHLEGTSLPVGGENTHAVLTGHTGLNTAKVFTDLTELKEGDLFFIHVLGDTLAYKVYDISVVEPSDTSKLQIQSGKDIVTLLTCTPYGVNSHRLLVTGERTEYTEAVYQESVDSAATQTDSQWMREYKKAIFIGLAIVVAMALILFAYKKIKKPPKQIVNKPEQYQIPRGACGRK